MPTTAAWRRYRLALAGLLAVAPLVSGALAAGSAPTPREPGLPVVEGSLDVLIGELTSRRYVLRGPASDDRPYVDPADQLGHFHRLALALERGDLVNARRLADRVGYELFRFRDTGAGREYLVLREDLNRIDTLRGWGSYLLNQEPRFLTLVEAPHPIDDANSARVAAHVFAAGARGLLIAGANRDKADVPDLTDSVFHQMHVAWVGPAAEVPAWQIHGFALFKHPFPRDADVILSTGDGAAPPELVEAHHRLEQRGFGGYVYNQLNPRSPLNKELNAGVPGVKFSSLAATKNEQGRYSRSRGGGFVHVELEVAVRADPQRRREAAAAIASAMRRTAGEKPLRVASRPKTG